MACGMWHVAYQGICFAILYCSVLCFAVLGSLVHVYVRGSSSGVVE